MNYHRTKFHVPTSNGSLIIAFKPKTKYIFRKDMLLL
jgi:hypothetical protein